jgi:hypothetical protein
MELAYVTLLVPRILELFLIFFSLICVPLSGRGYYSVRCLYSHHLTKILKPYSYANFFPCSHSEQSQALRLCNL